MHFRRQAVNGPGKQLVGKGWGSRRLLFIMSSWVERENLKYQELQEDITMFLARKGDPWESKHCGWRQPPWQAASLAERHL